MRSAGKIKKSQNVAYLWVLLPFLVVFLFCVYPAAAAIVRSFMNWTPSQSSWAGLANYREIFSDKLFGKAFGNMSVLTLSSLLTGNVTTFLVAELLFNLRLKRTGKVLRYLFVLPALVPGMVSVLLWKNVVLSGTEEGLMNVIMALFGKEPSAWYYDKSKVLLSMILTNFPWCGGVSFLIYFAGLQAIPESVYEACELEGLSPFKRVFLMDLPYLVGQIKYFVIIGLINGVQVYDYQLILGFSPIDSASTVPAYMLYYYTFGVSRYGCAAAIGVVLFAITLLFTVISNKISDKMRAENGV